MKRASVLTAAVLTAFIASVMSVGSVPASGRVPRASSGTLAITQQRPDGTAALFITDATGANAHRVKLGNPVEGAGSAIWSPDGGTLLITNALRLDGDQLLPFRPATIARDGASYTLLRPPGAPFDMFCDVWSPNGARVLCTYGGDERGIFAIRSSDGGNPVRLTRNPFEPDAGDGSISDIPGDYDPDGTRFVFTRLRPASAGHDTGGALFVKNTDGTGVVQRITPYGLPQWEEWGWAVHFSPDGSEIIFASVDGRLYLVHPDGTGLRKIHVRTGGGSYYAVSPDWSPDGSRIVFSMWVDGQDDIYTADPDGRHVTQVTDTEAWENSASWTAP